MKYKNIYVVCPYGLVTGGPDALHQLVYYLNENAIKSHLVYCDINKKNKIIPDPYKCYISEYLTMSEIIDSNENAIIVPETLTNLLDGISNAQKYIWWLSVQNDTNATPTKKIKTIIKKIFSIKNIKKIYKIRTLKNYIMHKKYQFSDKQIIHLCASYYAFFYVKNHTENNVHLLIEPISKFFLENSFDSKAKRNICLYNPKKNIRFTKKILQKAKHIKFIPLKGLSQHQLIDLYSKSKVYIDFGFFPGAERIPKEAVRCGCCIITGKYGASAFYNDVPIPDQYKIEADKKNIDSIIDMIEYCFNNYFSVRKEFDTYREVVEKLESNFISDIIKLFG